MNDNVKVRIEVVKGWIRLRWSCEGKRYSLALGVPESVVNRIVATGKAAMIEGDIATGNFDPTLAKYRPQRGAATPTLSIIDLLRRFTEVKRRKLAKETLSKYSALHDPISEFFSGRTAAAVDWDAADCFRVYLTKQRRLKPATVKDRLMVLSACWKWGINQGLVTINPWAEPLKTVAVPPMQKPKPFSQAEIAAILKAFRTGKHFSHYADFVEFRFGCGCRVQEAIGLQWKHLSEDCSTIWIGEAVSRSKVRKSTKTNRARQITLSPRLQQILLARRPADWQPDGLVFPAPEGGLLNDSNFSQRVWKKLLTEIKIPYRKFNSARHTFTSHALASGVKPMTVAEIAGHDPEVLFKHYASEIDGGLKLPDVLPQ